MTTSQHELQRITEYINELIKQAEMYFNRCFPPPALYWFTSGTKAGYAVLNNNTLHLHERLFAEHTAYYWSDVIPHEVAHLITHQVFGRVKPHGKEWQSVMKYVFAVTPSTTHQLPIEHLRRVKQIKYMCRCGDINLSMIRHNRVVQGKQTYRCRTCGDILRKIDT